MNAIALVLAAGRGSRMRSSLIKVLHPLLGIPMVMWPVRQARAAGLKACLVVTIAGFLLAFCYCFLAGVFVSSCLSVLQSL